MTKKKRRYDRTSVTHGEKHSPSQKSGRAAGARAESKSKRLIFIRCARDK
jgi:hypothetical protein